VCGTLPADRGEKHQADLLFRMGTHLARVYGAGYWLQLQVHDLPPDYFSRSPGASSTLPKFLRSWI
jgi:hypothetical protein